MQLAAIHRKLYGFRNNKICPYNARSIPARDIFLFPYFFRRITASDIPSKQRDSSMTSPIRYFSLLRLRLLFFHILFPFFTFLCVSKNCRKCHKDFRQFFHILTTVILSQFVLLLPAPGDPSSPEIQTLIRMQYYRRLSLVRSDITACLQNPSFLKLQIFRQNPRRPRP